MCYIFISNQKMEKFMTIVHHMKCACHRCLCVVSLENAIRKDGKYYCFDGCAEGHERP
ncbi:metallothionein [Trichormus azollae]